MTQSDIINYLGPAGGMIDTADQPLIDAWWTPGWNAQTKMYVVAPGGFGFLAVSFPSDVTFIEVTGYYLDENGSGLPGYLTFQPNSATIPSVDADMLLHDSGNGLYYRFPSRLSGFEPPYPPGINQYGSGKIFIRFGAMNAWLMATDTPGMTITDQNGSNLGTTFTYRVHEYFMSGRSYNITVPSNSTSPVDINTLIVPGSIQRNYYWHD